MGLEATGMRFKGTFWVDTSQCPFLFKTGP
nr:MAG TPA: hypothetical protein [Bacteriophage sp.]